MKIVCLVGKRKDWRLLREAEVAETISGNIVLTVGCIGPDGPAVFHDEGMVDACTKLHFKKIQMADEVLCVSKEIGENTLQDLTVAAHYKKPIRFYNMSEDEIYELMAIFVQFRYRCEQILKYDQFKDPINL